MVNSSIFVSSKREEKEEESQVGDPSSNLTGQRTANISVSVCLSSDSFHFCACGLSPSDCSISSDVLLATGQSFLSPSLHVKLLETGFDKPRLERVWGAQQKDMELLE